MKRNVTYVISQVSHSKLFEWTALLLNRDKYNLSFILMHKTVTEFETLLRKQGFSVHRIHYESKSDMISCIRKINRILRKEKTDIIHTHLFEGGLAGMTGARLARVKKRIHTRHDAMIHHDYHPGAVKYDKFTNRIATEIIAITENVKQILIDLENVDPAKVTVIHHGFELREFTDVSTERQTTLENKLFPKQRPFPVIGAISRFIEWKGLQHTIEAFEKVLLKNPNAHLLLANAQGPFEVQLYAMLKKLPSSSYTLVKFESDVAALYQCMDIFVHVPVDMRAEAFGQVYIEAMAAGIPMVVTASGIAPDCIVNREHALVVPFKDSLAIASAIQELIDVSELGKQLAHNAKEMALKNFDIAQMIVELEKRYDA